MTSFFFVSFVKEKIQVYTCTKSDLTVAINSPGDRILSEAIILQQHRHLSTRQNQAALLRLLRSTALRERL